MTQREKVWRFIRGSDYPVSLRDIAAALDMKHYGVHSILRWMRAKTGIVRVGKGMATAYIIPPGTPLPVFDRRGKSPGSRASRQNWDWRKGIEAANRARLAIKDATTERTIVYGGRAPVTQLTELDRCWFGVARSYENALED
jgi:hypothetical protein